MKRFGSSPANTGCKPCTCDLRGVASLDSICDVITGICKCRPGVEGVACDGCKQGYFNSSSANDKTLGQPCEPCSCDVNGTSSCDPETGHCSCKPNRTGPKCDTCLVGWCWRSRDSSGSEHQSINQSINHSLTQSINQ